MKKVRVARNVGAVELRDEAGVNSPTHDVGELQDRVGRPGVAEHARP
jgi:hypothetical protein